MHYYGLVFPLKNGRHAVEIPDIPEAFSEGETLEECLENACDVLAIAAEEYQAALKPLPPVSDPEDIWKLSHVSEFYAFRDPNEPIMLLPFKIPNPACFPVKVDISLTEEELAAIDKKARELGLSRSDIFVRGALAYEG